MLYTVAARREDGLHPVVFTGVHTVDRAEDASETIGPGCTIRPVFHGHGGAFHAMTQAEAEYYAPLIGETPCGPAVAVPLEEALASNAAYLASLDT